MMRERIGVLLVTALLLVGTIVPAAAGAVAVTGDAPDATAFGGATVAQQSDETAAENETADDSVDVSAGAQLATVLAVTNDDVQTDVDDTAFEVEYEDGDDETRVEVVAKRGAALRERAEAIRADYETATEAYENGSITASEYAQRLATLNARAENVLQSYEQLEVRSDGLSALELRAAGLNESALQDSVSDLDDLRGVGAAALLERFTGEREGELELRTADGLRIEFESEDGEESREFRRPRDADTSITVSQSAAFDTAMNTLSTPTDGEWVLEKASVHPDSGYYKFEFVLDSATTEGEAEVRVDGSTGEVFRLEEELEARDDDDDADGVDDAEEEDDERLQLIVTEGTIAPGETVTVQVLADGTPVEGATVTLNDRNVGTTDADGVVDVTLPTGGEAEFEAEHGEAEGELEFEFEAEDRVVRDLRVDAEQTDGRVTVTVTFQGSGVADATVFADGERVGTTDADGTVSFDAMVREDLEVEIVKGEFEAELTLRADGDGLSVSEIEVDGDDDESDEESDESDEAEEADDSDDAEEPDDSDDAEEPDDDEVDDEEPDDSDDAEEPDDDEVDDDSESRSDGGT